MYVLDPWTRYSSSAVTGWTVSFQWVVLDFYIILMLTVTVGGDFVIACVVKQVRGVFVMPAGPFDIELKNCMFICLEPNDPIPIKVTIKGYWWLK